MLRIGHTAQAKENGRGGVKEAGGGAKVGVGRVIPTRERRMDDDVCDGHERACYAWGAGDELEKGAGTSVPYVSPPGLVPR